MKRRQWKIKKEEKKRGKLVRRKEKRKRMQVEGKNSKMGQLVREKEESRRRYCVRLMMEVKKMEQLV